MKQKYWLMVYAFFGVVTVGIFDCPHDDMRAVCLCWSARVIEYYNYMEL